MAALPGAQSLRERYVAEADRVLADYREASEATPVTLRDFRRAQAWIAAALAIAPEDRSLRGRSRLVDGYLRLRSGDLRGARADFEEARGLLSNWPDPHLGLAFMYMSDGDLDQAQRELSEAERQRVPHRASRRQGAGRTRIASGASGGLPKPIGRTASATCMDALKRADDDLSKAENLYNAVAPSWDGVKLAERVSAERDRAAKSLAQAQQASGDVRRTGEPGTPNGRNPQHARSPRRAAHPRRRGPRPSRAPELLWLVLAA